MIRTYSRQYLLPLFFISVGFLAFTASAHAFRVVLSYDIPISADGVKPAINRQQVQTSISNEHIECAAPVFDFGLAVGGKDVWVMFPIKNRCEKLVYIKAIFPCSGTFRNPELGPILPGQTAYLILKVPTTPRTTTVSRGITVFTRVEDPPPLVIETYRLYQRFWKTLAPYEKATRYLKAYLLMRLTD